MLEAARRDPDTLVTTRAPVTLAEVQREPDLLLAIKHAIDRDRTPGRFLLTGSANLLLMRQVAESLAGRASYLTLWPMTRAEQQGLGRAGLWSALLDAADTDWPHVLTSADRPHSDWRALAGAVAIRRQPSSYATPSNARSGSRATYAPTSNVTSKTWRRSACCPISDG